MKKLLLVLAMWLAMVGAAFAQININTATKDQLDGLKGISPTKAQTIIDYRTKNGPFKTVDDLEKVNGIGPATMKDLRDKITVAGSAEVKPGDSLSKIAKGEFGNAKYYTIIFDANRDVLKDPNLIHPGQKLKIPPK